jgi:hypothetical protein
MTSATIVTTEAAKPRFMGMYGIPVYPRTHGFEECELDGFQIGAWHVIVGLYIGYWFVVWAFLPSPASLAISAVFFALSAATVSLKIIVPLLNNECDALFEPQLSDAEMRERAPSEMGKTCCTYCRQFVPQSSKHCSFCDKCIVGFDHHCRWLNTCVGEKNYRGFFAFVFSAWASTLLCCLATLWAIVRAFTNPAHVESTLRMMYASNARPALVVFQLIELIFGLVTLFGLSHLLGFHLNLIFTGQTTWQRIQAQRQEEMRERAERARREALGTASPTGADPTFGDGAGSCACCDCCNEHKRRDFKADKAARSHAEGGAGAAA